MEEEAKPRIPFIIGVAGGSASGKVTYIFVLISITSFLYN
jgi:uridine kinase